MLNFCKTFKFEKGLNVLIPGYFENSESLINEMHEYFLKNQFIKGSKVSYINIHKPSELFNEFDSKFVANTDKSIVCIIDGTSTDFMFMSIAEKLNIRMRINELCKTYDNLYIIFITDDYSYISGSRCMLIENARSIRNFKSYNAYSNFMSRSVRPSG